MDFIEPYHNSRDRIIYLTVGSSLYLEGQANNILDGNFLQTLLWTCIDFLCPVLYNQKFLSWCSIPDNISYSEDKNQGIITLEMQRTTSTSSISLTVDYYLITSNQVLLSDNSQSSSIWAPSIAPRKISFSMLSHTNRYPDIGQL